MVGGSGPRPVGRSARPTGRGRAQTAFDFMVGMSVFLVTIGLVFGFVPGLFAPFEADDGSNMIVADRSAAFLSEDLLAQNVTEPGVLDDTCTAEFFDADGSIGDCRFDADASAIDDALGIRSGTEVNVTVESDGTVASVSGGSVALSVGRAPPPTADVVVATRVVRLEDRHRTLFVRVW